MKQNYCRIYTLIKTAQDETRMRRVHSSHLAHSQLVFVSSVMSGLHSLIQHKRRQEWACEGYIRLILHALDLFLSRLIALGKMSVNCTQSKDTNISPHYWRYIQLCLVALAQECRCLHSCITRLVYISPKVLTSALDESVNPASHVGKSTRVKEYECLT